MRMFKHILCCSARGRTYNRLAILSMAMFLSSFSIVYFIYTSPGRANAYLYQFHIFQNSLYSAMQNGGRGFFEKMANASDLQELEYEPIGFKFLPDNFTYSKDEICPEKFPEMHGKIQVNMSEIPIEAINSRFSKQVSKGGSWQPSDCIAKYQVDIKTSKTSKPNFVESLKGCHNDSISKSSSTHPDFITSSLPDVNESTS